MAHTMTRPIVCYSISLFLGCFASFLFIDNVYLGAVFSAFFLGLMYFTYDKKFFVFIFVFFLFGVLDFYEYYSFSISSKNITIRVTQHNEKYTNGIYKNYNISLKGNVENLKSGEKIYAYGYFTKKNDYGYGTIGCYNIESSKKFKDDLLFKIYEIKRNIYSKFKNDFGEENTAEIMGLCFGDTDYLSDDEKSELKQLGVIHAISVSGFHICIVYKIISIFLNVNISLILTFIYVIFTGASSPSLRAFIMTAVMELSKKVHRNYDSLSSLSFSAIILMLWRPYYVFDIGFDLSYLATLGIILFRKKLKKIFYYVPGKINDSLSTTLSAQLFSLPFASMCFKNISLGFVFGNLILEPLYRIIVVLGNIALISVKLNFIYVFVKYIICTVMASINGAVFLLLKISPPIFNISVFDGIVLFSMTMSIIFYKHNMKKSFFIPLILCTLIFFENYYFFPEIKFINAGKNYCTEIRYRNNSILISENPRQNLIKKLSKTYPHDKIIYNVKSNSILNVDKGLSFIIKNEAPLCIEVIFNNKRVVFDTQSQNAKKYYDIINVKKKSHYFIIMNRIVEEGIFND